MSIETYTIDYFEYMLYDELQQFKGFDTSPNTRVMLKAISKQLQELLEAFKELVIMTTLNESVGLQLDNIGEIVKLTRAQAGMLSNEVTTDFSSIDTEILEKVTTPTALLQKHASNGIIPFSVIDDEKYREYLRYKIFLNTNTCTYRELMKSLKMFWTKSPVYYGEEADFPATIILSTPEITPEQNARLFFLIPLIKAAGVAIIRKATTVTDMPEYKYRIAGHVFNPISDTILPPLVYEHTSKADVQVVPFSENYTVTSMPELSI